LGSENRLSLHFYFGQVSALGRQGQKMTELAGLMPVAVGFTDNRSLEDLGLLRHLLEYLKPFGQNIALSPVNQQLKGNGVMREGETSIRFGFTQQSCYFRNHCFSHNFRNRRRN
jgi:dihydroorotase